MNEKQPNLVKKLPKPVIEKITLGEYDRERRKNLMRNIELGIGKAIQSGDDVIYTVSGDERSNKFIEYTILNAYIPS